MDIIAARREALSKYGVQSFVLPPPVPPPPVIPQRYFIRFCLPLLCLGVGRHQVMSAVKLLNVNYSLVIRINSADPNSFMARVSAV